MGSTVVQPKLILRLYLLSLLITVPKPDDLELDERGILVGEHQLERTNARFGA